MAYLPQTSGPLNTGLDRSITITPLNGGASVSLGGRYTSIKSLSEDMVEKSKGIDNGGRPDHVVLNDGWKATLTLDRYNGDADTFYSMVQQQRFSGQGDAYFTITETTNNARTNSTGITTYTYATFHNYDAGDWKKALVPISIEFSAQERIAS